MRQLEKKVAIITGATHGLGKTIAKKIADVGGEVVLIARDKDRLENLKKEIENAGGKAWIYTCDLRKPEMVREVASDIIAKHGCPLKFSALFFLGVTDQAMKT